MLKRISARLTLGSCLRSSGFTIVLALVMVGPLYPQGATPTNRPQPADEVRCKPPNLQDPGRRYDVIIVGAGLAGLSAANELQRFNRWVCSLDTNRRSVRRGYVGYIGHDDVAVYDAGAWL